MADLLTSVGEEYVFSTDVDGASIDVGLFNDSTDSISDGNDLADISTEPTNSNYNRQTDTVSVENPTGTDVEINTDTQLSFDFSDQTASETLDGYFVVVSFQSTIVNSDGSPTDHLIFTGSLSQDRDIGSIDTLNISSGSVALSLE